MKDEAYDRHINRTKRKKAAGQPVDVKAEAAKKALELENTIQDLFGEGLAALEKGKKSHD